MRFRRKKPVHTCEVCGADGVNRRDIWDHCPQGHTYVGERASA
jgi:hypothetical protein